MRNSVLVTYGCFRVNWWISLSMLIFHWPKLTQAISLLSLGQHIIFKAEFMSVYYRKIPHRLFIVSLRCEFVVAVEYFTTDNQSIFQQSLCQDIMFITDRCPTDLPWLYQEVKSKFIVAVIFFTRQWHFFFWRGNNHSLPTHLDIAPTQSPLL